MPARAAACRPATHSSKCGSVTRQERGVGGLVREARTVPVRGLVFVIELYRHMISPLRLPSCRFIPTCSRYAVDALRQYGLMRGSWLSVVRLAKCGPWHPGGWDPIPERYEYGRGNDAEAAACGGQGKQGAGRSIV